MPTLEGLKSFSRALRDIRDGKAKPMPTPPPEPDVYDTNYWGKPRLIKWGERYDGGFRVPAKFAFRLVQLAKMYDRGWHYRPPRRLSKRARQLNQMRRARRRK